MILQLPQLTADISFPALDHQESLLLIAGGRPPHTQWLQQAAAESAAIWAIDRGIDSCQQAGLPPARLIGDADSAAGECWLWAEQQNIPVDRFTPAKDLTDFQLALQLSRSEFPDSFLLVTGAFGGRLDHAFSLLYSLAGDGRPGCMADEQEILLLLRGGEQAEITLHDDFIRALSAFSLLPLSSCCSGVTVSGVRWPLDEAELTQQLPYAISNELLPEAKKISVRLADGVVGIYMMFERLTA